MQAERESEKARENGGGHHPDSAGNHVGSGDCQGAPARDTDPAGHARSLRKLRLDQYLKLVGFTPTGGQAKLLVQAGEVQVNGEVETRRGRGLRPGDRVEAGGRAWVVSAELWEDDASRSE